MGRKVCYGDARGENYPVKIAVTGATGFIGRAVIKELLSRGVDTTATSRHKPVDLSSFGPSTFISFDIKDVTSETFDRLERPDVLIHLAWNGLPKYQSLHHFEEELPLQYKFLKTLIAAGLSTVLVAGTCFEYGMQSGALDESLTTQPCTAYGLAKDALRKELELMKNSYNFSLIWTRIFYIYGEGQSENSLFSQLKKAVTQREQIFNMSGGEQLRDYLPVEKVASYLVSLALKRKDHGIVNICSGVPISVRRLVEEWIKKNDWEIKLNLGYYPYPDYEPMAFWGAKEKLDLILRDNANI